MRQLRLCLSFSILLLLALYFWDLPSSNRPDHALPRRVLLQLEAFGPAAAFSHADAADNEAVGSKSGENNNAYSDTNYYTHWHWDWEAVLALALATVNFAAAASTGQGGTAVLIPIFTSLLHLPVNVAVAVAIFVVWLGSVPSLYHAMVMPHPYTAGATLIDYSTMSILTPAMLVGIKAGVTLNKMSPDWFVSFLLIMAYSLSTGKQLHSMIKVRRQEAAMAKIMERVENEIAELERTESAVFTAQPEGHSTRATSHSGAAGTSLAASGAVQGVQAVITTQQPELWQLSRCSTEQQLHQEQDQVELQRRQTLCELQSDVQQLARLSLEVLKAEALTLSPHSLDTSLSSNAIMSTLEHLLLHPQQQLLQLPAAVQLQQATESASRLGRCSSVPHDLTLTLHSSLGAGASGGGATGTVAQRSDSFRSFGTVCRNSETGVVGGTASMMQRNQIGQCSSNRTSIAGLTESQLLQLGHALARANHSSGCALDRTSPQPNTQPAADSCQTGTQNNARAVRLSQQQHGDDSNQVVHVQGGTASSGNYGGTCSTSPCVDFAGHAAAAAAAAAEGQRAGAPSPPPSATQQANRSNQQQQQHVFQMQAEPKQQQELVLICGRKSDLTFWWALLLAWWSQQPQVLLLLITSNFIVYVIVCVIWSLLPPCHQGFYIVTTAFLAASAALAGCTCWLHWPATNNRWCGAARQVGKKQQLLQPGSSPDHNEQHMNVASSAYRCGTVWGHEEPASVKLGKAAPVYGSDDRLEDSAHILKAVDQVEPAEATNQPPSAQAAAAASSAEPALGLPGGSAAAVTSPVMADCPFHDIEWTPKRLLYFQPLMLVIGLLSGLLGASPNTLFLTPMLLSMGQHPQVAAATLKLALFISSGCSSVGFLLNGHLDVTHGLIFGVANLLVTPFGQLATDWWIRKTGCPSVILIINVARNVLAIPLLVWFNGVPGVIDLVHGTDVRFETAHICE